MDNQKPPNKFESEYVKNPFGEQKTVFKSVSELKRFAKILAIPLVIFGAANLYFEVNKKICNKKSINCMQEVGFDQEKYINQKVLCEQGNNPEACTYANMYLGKTGLLAKYNHCIGERRMCYEWKININSLNQMGD